MQPLMQGYKLQLNPQIILITATQQTRRVLYPSKLRLIIHPASSGSKEMIQMNIYMIIAIGNKGGSHLAPMNILYIAPEWLLEQITTEVK